MITKSHLDDLKSSGLNDDTIKQTAAFSSNTSKPYIGFEIGDCLVFPYDFPPPGGSIKGPFFYRVKPDSRTDKNDAPIGKYLSPFKSEDLPSVRLYIPPPTLAIIDDPKIPLYITEGEKKTWALIQNGFHAIGLSGVFCGCQKKENFVPDEDDPFGHHELLPEWHKINLLNRKIYIIFDSDRKDNPDVKLAEYILGLKLEDKGACVLVVPLYNNVKGEKQGVDDFIQAEGIEAFRIQIKDAYPLGNRLQVSISGSVYEFSKLGYHRLLKTKDGAPAGKSDLTNFTVHYNKRIVIKPESEKQDPIIIYEGYLSYGGVRTKYPFRWILDEGKGVSFHLGREISRHPGLFCTYRDLDIISQLVSWFNKDTRTVESRSSVGYDDEGRYITPSLYIQNGKIYPNKGKFPLYLDLARYVTYDFLQSGKEELPHLSQFLDDLLNFHRIHYTLAILGVFALAPVHRFLGTKRFLVFIEGRQSAGKTIILNSMMNFFKDSSLKDGLPSITSTLTDLEIDGSFASDAIFPVDDLKLEVLRDREIIAFIQGTHDGHGRSRRNKDLSLRKEYFVKGICIMTGEEFFQGVASSITRMIVVRVEGMKLNAEFIEEIETKRDNLRKIMPHYIAWTQRNKEKIKLYQNPMLEKSKSRTELFARQILTGLNLFLEFAVEECKWSPAKCKLYAEKAIESMLACVKQTEKMAQGAAKEEVFLDTLISLFKTGRATLDPKDTSKLRLGHEKDGLAYIYCQLAVKAVKDIVGINISPHSLGRSLKEMGLILQTSEEGGASKKVRIPYKSRAEGTERAWIFDANLFKKEDSAPGINSSEFYPDKEEDFPNDIPF